MINLNDIMQSAQGGQAVDNLSAHFGLSPAQTQSAISALLPALQMGLQNRLQGGGLGSLVSHLGNGVHQEAYQDATAAQSSTVAAHGGSILGELFGGAGTTTQVAQQAAAESGVPAAIIQSMLPVIASILMGGLAHGAQNGAFGGILSSVLGTVFGGGGAVAGTTQTAPSSGAPEGGLGGMLGSVLGGLFGGGAGSGPAGTPSAGGGPLQAPVPAENAPQSADGTLNEISNMIQSGAPASPQHEAALADILNR